MMISLFVVVLGVIVDMSSVDAQPIYPPDISSEISSVYAQPDYPPPSGSSVRTPPVAALKLIAILIGICLSASLRQYYCNPAADSKEDEKDVEAPPPPTTTTGNNNNMSH